MEQAIAKDELLYSRLGSDPDLGEIVTMFVEEMPDRIASLMSQLSSGDLENLRRTAHQLKGAAGSYGFDVISPAAGRLESAVKDNESLEQIRAAVEEIVNLCQRVRSGSPA
jgi:HPt (histidine-containing phosphotransfer) domain-containing protein